MGGLTRTTEEDDLIMRFLSAAELRSDSDLHQKEAKDMKDAIEWLRGLVGYINEDGSTAR